MVEHLLIGDLAAIFLVLGLTGPLLQPILAFKPLDRLRPARPAVALPLWAIDLYVWHIPTLYEATLSHPLLHALEHGMFILRLRDVDAGPRPAADAVVVQRRLEGRLRDRRALREHRARKRVHLVGARDISAYEAGDAAHGISPLTDQGIAGSIMMGEGMIVSLAILSWFFLKGASDRRPSASASWTSPRRRA